MQRLLYLCFGLLLLSACEKYRLKQPAFISFNWGYINDSATAKASINNIKFFLTDFTVSGTREQGDDVFMTKPVPDVQISCTGNTGVGLGIDVPVGNYKTFVVTFNVPKKSPGLILNGVYKNGNEDIPLRIEWTEEISVDFSTTELFELKKKNSYNMELGIDLQKLFENVSASQWTTANISNEGGVPTLVVRAGHNDGIFNDIKASLSGAVYLKAP